jgi:nitronate monooxygenase
MPVPAIFDRLRIPVIGAPLFIVSNPDLVIAQCKSGIVGSFPDTECQAAKPARRVDPPDHGGAGGL